MFEEIAVGDDTGGLDMVPFPLQVGQTLTELLQASQYANCPCEIASEEEARCCTRPCGQVNGKYSE